LSQSHFPKQFISLFNNKPLINQTIERIEDYFKPAQRFLVIPEELKKITKRFVGKENLLIEPARKNTAPAICLCAMILEKRFGDGIMHIMPADHMIGDKRKFIKCLKFGEEMADKGFLVTYGIIPDRPETGYGYIKIGKKIYAKGKIIGFYGEGFTEKPSLIKARHYLKTKRYLWNSGIFTYKISVLLEEVRRYLPEVYHGVSQYLRSKNRAYFEKIPAISIDYGIMEKTRRICVIKSNFGWDDVGTWLALERYFKKDSNNNIFIGNIIGLETKDSIIYTNNMPVRLYGIKGLVVVASPDGVLICRKERAADIKRILKTERERRL
jgi:mannose-1-phosphate guanylyltransferase